MISVPEETGCQDPEYGYVQFFQGNSHMAADDLDTAEGHFKKAFDPSSKRASWNSPLALLNRKQGRTSTE